MKISDHWKFCKNAIKCQQAEFRSSIRLDFTAERVKWFILIYEVKIFFWNSSSCILMCPVYTNHRNIGKSVTVVKSFERSFICHQVELICSNRLVFTTKSVQASQSLISSRWSNFGRRPIRFWTYTISHQNRLCWNFCTVCAFQMLLTHQMSYNILLSKCNLWM